MDQALELRFRPTGWGRWLEAVFLSVWLLVWAAGEAFALAGVGALAWTLFSGRAIPNQPDSPMVAVLLAAFLLTILAFWSLGGLLALRAWLGCFWAEDRLRLTATDLEWQQRLGPWRRRRRLPRAAVESVLLARRGSSRGGALIAQLTDRQEELTRLGTPGQRQEAAALLGGALAADPARPRRPAAAALPDRWECETPSFGPALLVPRRRTRRIQTLVLAGPALLLAAQLVSVVQRAWSNATHLPLVLLVAPLTAAAWWGVVWLALGRQEWRLGSAELVAQSRFCGRVRERFTAQALTLEESVDDDGDDWFELKATQLQRLPGGEARIPASVVLCRRLHDPSEPLSLGRWLARRTGIRFDDHLPSAEEREDLRRAELDQLQAQLQAQLRASGRLGSWLARRLRPWLEEPDPGGGPDRVQRN